MNKRTKEILGAVAEGTGTTIGLALGIGKIALPVALLAAIVAPGLAITAGVMVATPKGRKELRDRWHGNETEDEKRYKQICEKNHENHLRYMREKYPVLLLEKYRPTYELLLCEIENERVEGKPLSRSSLDCIQQLNNKELHDNA
jgi:hypothetical protein